MGSLYRALCCIETAPLFVQALADDAYSNGWLQYEDGQMYPVNTLLNNKFFTHT